MLNVSAITAQKHTCDCFWSSLLINIPSVAPRGASITPYSEVLTGCQCSILIISPIMLPQALDSSHVHVHVHARGHVHVHAHHHVHHYFHAHHLHTHDTHLRHLRHRDLIVND